MKEKFDRSAVAETSILGAWLTMTSERPETPLEVAACAAIEKAWELAFKLKARDFCIMAHGEQKRKYSGEPYWTHPAAVASLIEIYGGNVEMIAAAYLHDTVEDTDVKIDQIEFHFGPAVKVLVDDLTDKTRPEDGNRATRKELDRQRLKGISAAAKSIKCIDIAHNLVSIAKHDKDFARSYFKEKRACLEFLSDASIPGAFFMVEKMILDWFDQNP